MIELSIFYSNYHYIIKANDTSKKYIITGFTNNIKNTFLTILSKINNVVSKVSFS